MADIQQIAARVKQLREKARERDSRWADVLEVRKGNINKVFPGLFPDDYPKPMVANFIDIAHVKFPPLGVSCSVLKRPMR